MIAALFKSRLFIAVGSIAVFLLYSITVFNYGESSGATDLIMKYNKETKEKEDEILKLKNDLATARQDAISISEQLGVKYEEKLYEQEASYKRSLSDLESDNIRLRVDISERNPPRTGATAPPPPKACDDERREAYLPKDTSRLLIDQANRADRVVQKLTTCQETVKLYLELADRYNRLIMGDKNAPKRIQLDD